MTTLDIASCWRSLRHRITREKQSDKKVFTGEEITFQVPSHQYNPQIPTLSGTELLNWLSQRESRHRACSQSDLDPSCQPSPATEPEYSRQTTPTPSPTPIPTPDSEPEFQRQRHSTPVLTSESSLESSSPIIVTKRSQQKQQPRGSLDPDGSKRQHKSKNLPQSDTNHRAQSNNRSTSATFHDTLVIHEDYEDEFAKYIDDDDDIETELSKNKKKIQTKGPKVAPPPPPPPLPAQPKPRTKPAPPKKTTLPSQPIQPEPIYPDVPMDVDQQQPAPKVLEPDWPDTLKQLQNGNLMTVLKDLVHFKSKITGDLARSIPKTLILKCVLEDDLFVLPDSLDLIIELDCYWEDFEFWSEMIMRFKRKLSQHCKIYRNQRDPIETRRQYESLMKRLSAYVDKRNITCKIPVDAMKLLLSFAEDKAINKTNGQDIKTCVKKEQVTVPIMNSISRNKLTECKKENVEIKTGFDGRREIKPDILPNGRISFKIRRPRVINNRT